MWKKWCFSKRLNIDPGASWESFWDVWDQFLKIPSSKCELDAKFENLQNPAQKRRKMRKMRCWKWNFLSQRWKTIKGAPGLRMTRRALSRRVNSELGRVWPDLAWHAARWTPIFRSIWGGILNISQNLTIQSNWSQCEIYTLKYCASARFIRNWIELSEILKFNDYCPSWGENFENFSIF